ncbi:MAG: ATP-dependent protease ATPase subunit HslU [Clostridiales bacterium]|nr:ATP-dependent protease ATPase subunit HslU [Clostridiales bacterium]
MREHTPRQVVAELDKYIVGQDEAKRAVAIALRNRYRRRLLPPEVRDEVTPKNILMIGPTGVGKTEIARRMAKLVKAPFLKVEATKFTEVGYVGRDVDSIIRDLTELAVRMVKAEKMEAVKEKAEELAQERILEYLKPLPERPLPQNPFEVLLRGSAGYQEPGEYEYQRQRVLAERAELRKKLLAGELEGEMVEIEVEENLSMLEIFTGQGIEQLGVNLKDAFGNLFPPRKKKRRMTVAEARRILAAQEAEKLIDEDQAIQEAIHRVEQDGVVFIDEIDKIAGRDQTVGPDVSREGVQRDLLPLVEGSTVMTKYGPVKTDHILFIAAGAFHISKPSDLIPELQGRFPIRVELSPLTRADLRRILSEPENSLVRQYQALLAADGVRLQFTEDGLDAIAEFAEMVNQQTENIGARRLHTIMEKLLEDISFQAPEEGGDVVIDRAYVEKRLASLVEDRDLSRYVL